MMTRQLLDKLLETLTEEHLRELLDFAQFLSLKQEQQEWSQAGALHLAKCYGPDESEYSEADIRPEPKP